MLIKVTHRNNIKIKNCTITPYNSCQKNMSMSCIVVIVIIATKQFTSRTPHQRNKNNNSIQFMSREHKLNSGSGHNNTVHIMHTSAK